MRIGLLMETPSISRATGIGRYGYHLALALAQRADVETVQLLTSKTGDASNVAHPKIKIRELPASRRFISKIVGGSMFLEGVARSLQLDVLHETNQVAPFLLPGATPRALTIHDLTTELFPEHHPPYRFLAHGFFMRRSAHGADKIIVPSESTRRDVINVLRVPAAAIRVIPHGCDEEFRPGPISREVLRRLGADPPYLLYVGTLEPRKNLERLIDAFARAKLGDIRLVLAGRPGWMYSDVFKRIRRYGLEEKVRQLDYVPRGDLPHLYRGALALVYPSLYEGFGFPPLEAMSCGLPVVVSNRSSLPEVVGDAGLQVNPEDVDAIAQVLRAISDDSSLRRTLHERGLLRAAKFSWSRCAAETFALYRELVNASRREGNA